MKQSSNNIQTKLVGNYKKKQIKQIAVMTVQKREMP